MRASNYEALVVPSLGANAIRLTKTQDGRPLDILRTPPDDQTLLNDPYAYGMPVLFPANRVANGEYCWDGVTYRFPQNYPNGVHIHGVLHNREWPVTDYGCDAQGAWALMEINTDTDAALRSHFPLSMTVSLKLTLNENGLTHRFAVENRSEHELPVGLAYHTALRVDFCGVRQGVRLHVPLACRCVDDPVDRLPNGATEPLNDFERRIALAQGADPLEMAVDTLYKGVPNAPEAVMRDALNGYETVYHAGPENHYWILWNETATEGFIAVEPQTWLSNAMGTASPKENGALFVPPHQSWASVCTLSARALKE